MTKIILTIFGCLSLLVAGLAQAQVVQRGVTYFGGAQLELSGSKVTFTIPAGWSGRYNAAEQLFEMMSPSGQNVSVGYEGKSYANAISYAKKPVTSSDGIVMTPVYTEKVQQGHLSGEAFAYKGTMLFISVGAVAVVVKTPENKGLTISSVGLGDNFKDFSAQIGLVTPSLTFAKQEQPQSSQARITTANKDSRTEHSSTQKNDSAGSSHSRQSYVPSMPVHMPVYQGGY